MNQIVSSMGSLLGEDAAEEARQGEELPSLEARSFPPLNMEGTLFYQQSFEQVDRMSERAAKAAAESFTACGTAPTEDCAREYVTGLAKQAFRRPTDDFEIEDILTVFDECRALGATMPEAVAHATWAILGSPLFLYRTEFGEGDTARDEVPLTPYELADELSYFLTDGPPDAELLRAANRDELSTDAELAEQAARLLETPRARENLEAAMFAYLGFARVPTTVLDPMVVPGVSWSAELAGAMVRESRLFLEHTLWDGTLGELLTSRRAWVNESLAMPIYGVPAPTRDLDASGFGPVELPAYRAGLLTSSTLLTSRSYPSGTSAVQRGLFVNALLACQLNPAFPEGDPNIFDAIAAQAGLSEKEAADARAQEPICAGCHDQFDVYGLSLDMFDAVGRYRTTDLEGRAVEPVVVLPELFDRELAETPADMAAIIAGSKTFASCMALRFGSYALGDETQGSLGAPLPNQPIDSCAIRDIVRAFRESADPSFGGLMVRVGSSPALRLRRGSP